jgi:hypothetical protein
MSQPEFMRELSHSLSSSPERIIHTFLGTFLVNQAAQIFRFYEAGGLDESTWLGVMEDIRDMFTWPIVRERWEAVRPFHTPSFREFIDHLLGAGSAPPSQSGD